MIKRSIKSLLRITNPIMLEKFLARRYEDKLGLPVTRTAFVKQHGRVVLHGPFQGMRYVEQAVGSAFVPKLLGSYEQELHDIVAQFSSTNYKTVVDVGCAEGYYAVGLALSLPGTIVYAFDIDQSARRLCASMAEANQVKDRVTIGGKCTSNILNELIIEKSLVVCDCEGFEIELLDIAQVPRLAEADILVELHDCIIPGVTEKLLRMFADTHTTTLVTSVSRVPGEYSELDFLEENERERAISEWRSPGQQWAFLKAKTKESTG